MVYVRQEYLPNLKLYKYSAVDHSLTSKYILKPFYNNVVIKCFPMGMAPNLITLTGFMFVVANFFTLLWYSPNLDQDCPPWVYYSWAAGLFLYQTFDAVDGAQARRTRQSGPLGELFDHGVDALNTALGCLIFSGSQNMGQSWYTVATLFAALLTFYTQTWEEYHTKTLTLGIVNGPVEGVLILVSVYALTGYMGGGSIWQHSMLATLGVPKDLGIPAIIYDLSFTQWYMVQGVFMVVFNTFESARNVIKARRARGDRSRWALLGLVPFFATWAWILAYLYLQPVIRTQHIVPFAVFAGIVNAYSVGQMITAHLVRLKFPYWNVLVVPLAGGVIDSLGPVLQSHIGWASGWPSALGDGVYQVAFMFSLLGMAIGVYGSFVVDVIVTICDYLDIWCLTIKHPAKKGPPELPGPPPSFARSKARILAQLAVPDAEYTDASPKGSVDAAIRDLIAEVNALDGFVTTSSCAGRVSVFVEGRKKKKKQKEAGTELRQLQEADDDDDDDDDGDGAPEREEGWREPAKPLPSPSEKLAGVGGKGGGGTWLFVSHDPVAFDESAADSAIDCLLGLQSSEEQPQPAENGGAAEPMAVEEPRLIHFKFEPMILHVLTASPEHAQLLLRCGLQAGFRESGAINLTAAPAGGGGEPATTPIVAIRSMGLALESLIGTATATATTAPHHGPRANSNSQNGSAAAVDVTQRTVSAAYLKTLLRTANDRFVANTERIERFRENIRDTAGTGGAKEGQKNKKKQQLKTKEDGTEWEDAQTRRERMRAEGLRKKAELQREEQQRQQTSASASAEGDEETYALDSYVDNAT